MLLQDSFLPTWFGFTFRLIALLLGYGFLSIAGISTLDKYRHIDRDVSFEEIKGKDKAVSVWIIVANTIVICVIGIVIAVPFVSGDDPYIVYEMISGCGLCTLAMWMVIDITYHKSTENNKFRLLVISYTGFFVLLIMGLVIKGVMEGFIALFIIYMVIELNGATAWIAMGFNPEKEMRLVKMSLIPCAVLPLLVVLAALVTDPAMQLALGVSGVSFALISIYYSMAFKENKVTLTKINIASLVIAIGTSIFLPPNGLWVSVTALSMASMTVALLFILIVYACSLVFLLDMLLKRSLDFKKGNRVKALIVYAILTTGFWGLFFLLRAGFVYQGDFLVQVTLCPVLWASLTISIFQTIASIVLLCVALLDLTFIQALIKWFAKNTKVLCFSGLACFVALTILIIVFFFAPSIFVTYPGLSILTLVVLIAGVAMMIASFYGRYDGTRILLLLYIILGIAATLLFAPLPLGIIGLVALVFIFGMMMQAILDKKALRYTMPFVLGLVFFMIALLLMYVRLENATNSVSATAAGVFEWFFALMLAADVIVSGLRFSDSKKGSIGVFIAGVALLMFVYSIAFEWPTKDSLAISNCWLVSAIILLLLVMVGFFKYYWTALHQEKWSSVIVSILASGIIMISSGTKFTSGMSDIANAAISICLVLALLVIYYACTFKMMKAYKQRKLEADKLEKAEREARDAASPI
ncbi:MAG TPA: hypothetical protein VKM55_25720 [Candidatus Lokiarchaeia archaeon]|nr:hypothetical protein [Candidatus Lokiarchaeia archaeon]